MDAKLAEIYGTNSDVYDDLEKVAAAELVEKLAAEEGIDIDSLDDDQLEMLAQEVLESEYGYSDDSDDESLEKISEADYLGRVMAHSYWQELSEIEKNASRYTDHLRATGQMPENLPGAPGKLLREGKMSVDDIAGRVEKARKAKAQAGAGAEAARDRTGPGLKKRLAKMRSQNQSPTKLLEDTKAGNGRVMSSGIGNLGDVEKQMAKQHGVSGAFRRAGGWAKGHANKAWGLAKAHPYAAGGIAAGTLAAGGLAAHQMSKQSSAIDALAEMRANEILESSQGIDPYDMLGDVVESRALEMLQEAGYDVE